MTVTIAPNCTACGLCLVTCPTHALVPAPRRPDVIDARCTDCWLCLEVCPVDSITALVEAASPPPPAHLVPPRPDSGSAAASAELVP